MGCMTDPLRVFIVEDEALIAMDLESMIEDAGHDVVGEADSLSSVKAHSGLDDADLFLVDVGLRGGDSGIDVADYLRTRTDAIIIFTTGNQQAVPADCGSGDGVIGKPLQRGIFMRTLTYLHQCERRPPPASALPDEVRMAKSLSKRCED